MSSIHDRAAGRWPEIWVELFGISRAVLDGRHHDCPGCGRKGKFRINPKRIEHGVWFCGNEAKGGLDLCMHVSGLEFRETAEIIEKLVGKGKRQCVERTIVDVILENSRPLRASRYLQNRGIEDIPPGLLGIKELEYRDGDKVIGKYPAIIAPLRRGSKIVTVQATYLHNSMKAPVPVPKKTMPGKYQTINGAAVRLGEYDGEVLGFAEGVETALSARQMFGHAVWATLSTSGMRTVDWPKGLKRAVIYADNDRSLAGHAAAWHLAHRMAVQGVDVEVKFPPEQGTDWNDVLQSMKITG